MTWVLLAIVAAAFQTLRFALQKTLNMGALSTGGATAARFVYAAPLALGLGVAIVLGAGAPLPSLGGWFWPAALVGAAGQVLATWAMVALFSHRNFAVGIAFKKSEVVQAALLGLVVLGDRMSPGGFAAIVLGMVAVLILSDSGLGAAGRGLGRFANRAAGLGLTSGAFFAISAVGYRAATLEVASDMPLMRAAVTLAAVTASQALAMAVWLAWREPGENARILAAWRRAGVMGLASVAGSLCWFTAFTLQNAGYVFAVGQVEVIFSIAVAVAFFGERITRRELSGIALLTVSIVALVLLR